MNEQGVSDLLSKAEQSLDAAKHLMNEGYHDFAAARAYYAMFYGLEALYLSREQGFSKHSAIISAFGKDFIKPGIFNEKFHRYLLEAFELRNAGDYGTIHSVPLEKTGEIITKAGDFIKMIDEYLVNKD